MNKEGTTFTRKERQNNRDLLRNEKTIKELLCIKLRQTREIVKELTKESKAVWREIDRKYKRGSKEWRGIRQRIKARTDKKWEIETDKKEKRAKWLIERQRGTRAEREPPYKLGEGQGKSGGEKERETLYRESEKQIESKGDSGGQIKSDSRNPTEQLGSSLLGLLAKIKV